MAKKKTKKRTPVKKTTGGRKKKKKAPVEVEAEASKQTGGKKKPPKKDPVKKIDFSGEHNFLISGEFRDRFQKIAEATGDTDLMTMLTKVFEAGLNSMEETLGSKASGNLIDDGMIDTDDDDNDAYDPEFEEVFNAQLAVGL